MYTSFEIQWLAQLSFSPVRTQKLQRSVGLKPWFAGSTGKTTSIANDCVYRNSACLYTLCCIFALYGFVAQVIDIWGQPRAYQ